MENKLQIFNNPDFGQIQAMEIEGKMYFPATRVAEALGYREPEKAIRDHCREKGVSVLDTPSRGGNQKTKFIDEGNLYRLIASSKLPGAEQFESWIFDEVIPQIRKHGVYYKFPNKPSQDMFNAHSNAGKLSFMKRRFAQSLSSANFAMKSALINVGRLQNELEEVVEQYQTALAELEVVSELLNIHDYHMLKNLKTQKKLKPRKEK